MFSNDNRQYVGAAEPLRYRQLASGRLPTSTVWPDLPENHRSLVAMARNLLDSGYA